MFTVQYAKNLKWTNPEHTAFDCDVKFNEVNEEWPFHCMQSEQLSHTQELWTRCIAGEFGTFAEYVEGATLGTEPQPDAQGAQQF